MKPKEKFMKCILFMFVVSNYTKSEYIDPTYIDKKTLNFNSSDKLGEKSEIHSECITDNSKESDLNSNRAVTRLSKISRYQQRDEIPSITTTLKQPHRMLPHFSKSRRNDNIGRRKSHVVREIKEVSLEMPKLKAEKMDAPRTVSLERSSGNVKACQSNFFKQERKTKINGYTVELPVIKSNIRHLSRKFSLNRCFLTRQLYMDNSGKETNVSDLEVVPDNEFGKLKQNSVSEGTRKQTYEEKMNNIEQNKHRRNIGDESIRKKNDREQINRIRGDRIRANSRDNKMRLAVEERSPLSNRLIQKDLNIATTGNLPTTQTILEETVNGKTTLNRQKRNVIKQTGRRIRSTGEILNDANSRQSKKARKFFERNAESGHRDSVRKKLSNNHSSTRQSLNKNTEERDGSNERKIRENRLERNTNRRRSENRKLYIQTNYQLREIRNFCQKKSEKDDRLQSSCGRREQPNEGERVLSSLYKSINRKVIEKRQSHADPSLSKSTERRMENNQNENKHMDIIREINIRNSAKNIRRNRKQEEKGSQRSTSEKEQTRLYEINKHMEQIRSGRELKNTRYRKREITRNQRDFRGETRLSSDVNSGIVERILLPSENGHKLNIRLLKVRKNERKENLETRDPENQIVLEHNEPNQNRIIRNTRRKLVNKRQNIETENEYRILHGYRQRHESSSSSSANIELHKSRTDMNKRNLPNNSRQRNHDKAHHVFLTENNRLKQKRSLQVRLSDEDEVESAKSLKQNILKTYIRVSISDKSRNRIHRASKSNFHERNDINRQRKSLEMQQMKRNENLQAILDSADKRKYVRDVRNKEKQITGEDILSSDRSIRKGSNRNVYRLQGKRVRLLSGRNTESRQKESKNNFRHIRQTIVDVIRITKGESPHNKISENILKQILIKNFFRKFEKLQTN